jgi:hypothetical protein
LQPTKALGFLGDYMGLMNVGEDFLALFSQPPTEAGTRRSNEEVGERVGQRGRGDRPEVAAVAGGLF